MSEPEIIGPGDFYEEPRQGMGPLAKILAIGGIAVGVVVLAGVVWFAYQQGIRSGAEDAAPVIRAADEPIKREPKNPGGLDVPHQDKLVFGRLAPGQIQEPVERLLPPPEEPAERPAAPVTEAPQPGSPVAETPAAQAEPATPENATPAPPIPPVAAAPEPAVVAAKPPPAPPKAEARPEPAPAASPPVEPATKPAAKPTEAGSGWRVQLAAVSSREAALTEWDRLKKRNNDLLGALSLNVQSVKLDRGTFYRIQAGPLAGRDAANDICGALKSRNQACLIVAP